MPPFEDYSKHFKENNNPCARKISYFVKKGIHSEETVRKDFSQFEKRIILDLKKI